MSDETNKVREAPTAEAFETILARMLMFENALGHIRWIKDCGIDTVNANGLLVNHPADERDCMYEIAGKVLSGIPCCDGDARKLEEATAPPSRTSVPTPQAANGPRADAQREWNKENADRLITPPVELQDDLSQRLRDHYYVEERSIPRGLMWDAAERIDALQADLDALQAVVDELAALNGQAFMSNEEFMNRSSGVAEAARHLATPKV